MYPEFEDPPGSGGRNWAGPEQTVKVFHVRNSVLKMYLPE